MKKALIIGVSGFIGRHLYKSLSAAYDVQGISRTQLAEKNCVAVDLRNKKGLIDFLKERHFDVILNLACITAKSENLKDGKVLLENMEVSLNITEALAMQSGAHVINFSSSSVYPNTIGDCEEASTIDPSQNADGLYGLAKFNAEMIFNYFLKGKHDILQLRIPIVYGEGMDQTRLHAVFKKELKELNTITVFGEGKRLISHIAVTELCEKIRTIIEKKITGTFNLSGESTSLLQLAEKMIRESGNENSKIILLKDGSQSKFIFNGSKLDREIAS